MTPIEYLYRIKQLHRISSDYKLAEFLNIPRPRISNYVKGERMPDTYACIRMALALNLDPLEVISDIEQQSEKNEQRREFWKDFHSRITRRILAAVVLACTVFLLAEQPGGNGLRDALYRLMFNLKLRIMGDYVKRGGPALTSP